MKSKLVIAVLVLAAMIAATILLDPYTVFGYKETATSYQDGHNKGYNDAIDGFYYVEDSHTDTYKQGYQDGYRAGIASLHGNDNSNSGPITDNLRSNTKQEAAS
jgi:hypothetical protein